MAQTPAEIDSTNRMLKLKGIDIVIPGGTEPKPVEEIPKPTPPPQIIYVQSPPIQIIQQPYEQSNLYKIYWICAIIFLFVMFLWFLSMSWH